MKAPESPGELKHAIVEQYDSMTGHQRKIAQYAVDHPNDIAINTLAEIARRIDVQPSSLVRFAQRLGLSGFSEVQQIFRSQLIRNFAEFRERVSFLEGNSGLEPAGNHGLLAKVAREAVIGLQNLVEDLSDEGLERAAEIFASCRQVYILGVGRAFPVAYFTAFSFTRISKPTVLLDGVGGTLVQRQMANLISSEDALLAISFRPYTPMVVDIATSMKEAGVPVVVITDSPLSPLAKQAVVSLEARDEDEYTMRSFVAPMCLAQALVTALGQRLNTDWTVLGE